MAIESPRPGFAAMSLRDILHRARERPLAIARELRAAFGEAHRTDPDSPLTQQLQLRLYWTSMMLMDAASRRLNPGAQIDHSGLDIDMGSEPRDSLTARDSFEPIEMYYDRLQTLKDKKHTNQSGEYWLQFESDLTKLMQGNKLDPSIGRSPSS